MLTVYGIPSCGTVKKARAWLLAKNAPHTFVDFRATPPTAAQVRAWVATFGATAMKNTSGGAYRALGPEKDSFTDADWTARFIADAMLIKRPIIERDGAPVLVGFRAPEKDLRARLLE
jgi:arsenate reductase